MSDDGVLYVYTNTGTGYTEVRTPTQYVYTNTQDAGTRSFVGRVVGLAARPRIETLLLSANVGAWFDELLGRPGVGWVMCNQLEQVSGAGRTMEDATARLLEDGTTQRTLE